jgi:translation initiation factor IF-1
MDAYAFALALGTAGMAAMTVLGFHHGHAPGGPGHGHQSNQGHSGGGHAGSHAGHHHHGSGHQHHAGASSRLLLFLSPRLWFSLLVGFGATGLLVGQHATAGVRLGVALLGALAFEALLVRPIWSLATRFASDPAMTLETGVMDDAEAVTGFNAKGEGLVRLDLDGQVVQLLGVLTSSERDAGIRVAAGDRLLVEAVDPARQRCTVSRRDSAGPLGNPSSL